MENIFHLLLVENLIHTHAPMVFFLEREREGERGREMERDLKTVPMEKIFSSSFLCMQTTLGGVNTPSCYFTTQDVKNPLHPGL